jgi:hypothetical protein
MTASSRIKNTKKDNKDQKDKMLKIYIPEHLANRTRAHAIMLGERNPTLVVVTALNEYFARQPKGIAI